VHRPSRRHPLGSAAIVAAALLLPSLSLPAVASADATTANTWAGGTLGSARDGAYAAEGALVSLVTGPKRARIAVQVYNRKCFTNSETRRATTTVVPGAVGDHVTLNVAGTVRFKRRQRYGTVRTRVRIDLKAVAPGVLQGTVKVSGDPIRSSRRPLNCSQTTNVQVRSQASLAAPLAPMTADPAALRTGFVALSRSPRVPGAIAIAKRSDGYHHAYWTLRMRCRSAGKTTTLINVNYGRRFRVRADGTFRGRELLVRRGKRRDDRWTRRIVLTIKGRIDPDGVARGTVASADRLSWRRGRFYGRSCRMPATAFAAAP
jgi:hypothetical protein